MGNAFAFLAQAALETYAAMAADLPLVTAIAQAILQLWNQRVTHIKN